MEFSNYRTTRKFLAKPGVRQVVNLRSGRSIADEVSNLFKRMSEVLSD